MVRIEPTPREEADPRSEAEFQRIESLGGYVPNMHLTFGSHPELYVAWLPFAVHVMPNSTLEPRDRQLLILATSYAWRAPYPWSHHVRISEALGVLDPTEANRIADGSDHPWPRKEAALLAACSETREQGGITDSTWAVLAEFLDKRQLVDVVFTIGQYGLIATALNSLGVELDPGFDPPAWYSEGDQGAVQPGVAAGG